MSYERNLTWAKRFGQVTPQGFLYDLDGLAYDGGYYLLFVPEGTPLETVTEARVWLRNQVDVVHCKVVILVPKYAA